MNQENTLYSKKKMIESKTINFLFEIELIF